MQLDACELIQKRGPLIMPPIFEQYVKNAAHAAEIKLLAAARARGTQQAHDRSLRHLENYLHMIGSCLDRMTTKNLKFYLRLDFNFFCFIFYIILDISYFKF